VDKCCQFAKYFNKLICVIFGAPGDISSIFDYFTVTVFQIMWDKLAVKVVRI
jgi:hypothetical protein